MTAKKKMKNMKTCGVKSEIIRSMTKNSDDYNETYMKIKFNLDDKLPLNKMREMSSMIIVVRAVS